MTQEEYDSCTLYTIDSLYTADYDEEAEYVSETGGVCSGMSLEWLRRTVGIAEDPETSVPDVVYSRVLQMHVENNDVWLNEFPECVGLTNIGRWDFSDLNEGLEFVYNHPGNYLLAYMPNDERGGHAYGFISRKRNNESCNNIADYLLDPAYACYRIYTREALGNLFRVHPYVSDYEGDGMKLMVIQVEKCRADADDGDNEHGDGEENGVEDGDCEPEDNNGTEDSYRDWESEIESDSIHTVVEVDEDTDDDDCYNAEYCVNLVETNNEDDDCCDCWCHL